MGSCVVIFLPENRLDLILAAAERDDEVRMVVNMEVDGLTRLQPICQTRTRWFFDKSFGRFHRA